MAPLSQPPSKAKQEPSTSAALTDQPLPASSAPMPPSVSYRAQTQPLSQALKLSAVPQMLHASQPDHTLSTL